MSQNHVTSKEDSVKILVATALSAGACRVDCAGPDPLLKRFERTLIMSVTAYLE